MKKVYLLSTLLCATVSLSAQEVMQAKFNQEACVPVKATARMQAKTCVTMAPSADFMPRFANPVKKLNNAPAAGNWDVATSPLGVYSAIMYDDEGQGYFKQYMFDRWYLPAMTDTRWNGWYLGENLDFSLVEEEGFILRDINGNNDDIPMDTVTGGYGVMQLFGSSMSEVVRYAVYDGEYKEWGRMDALSKDLSESMIAAGITEPQTGFYTPMASAYTAEGQPIPEGTEVRSEFMSMANTGNIWGYYGGYSSGEYYGDGGYPGQNVTGLVQKFTATASPLYIFGGNIICSSANVTQPIKDAEKISFEIWTLVDGELSEMLASDTGRSVGGNTLNNYIGSIMYVFQDKSSMIPQSAPVMIPAGVEFAIVVRNIAGTNMKVMFSGDYGAEEGVSLGVGGGFWMVDDAIFYPDGGTRSGSDFALGLDAYMPVAKFNGNYLAAPVEGGDVSTYYGALENGTVDPEWPAAASLSSTHPYVDCEGEQHMEITAPDWITSINADTTGYSMRGNFPVYMTAEPLPAGMENRHGVVKVSMYGYESSIRIGQGTGWSGVETTVAEAEVSANVVAGDFVLTYGEGVDKVDVYNVAGSLVASYALPANGYFTVPASDWAKGLYVLNFTGEKKATVKVVK